MVPLKLFWRTPQIPLVNCEISLLLIWRKKYFLVAETAANQGPIFTIADTKLYGPVVTLLTKDSRKLLKQLESGIKRTINWN